jgi:CHC2 zinc finger
VLMLPSLLDAGRVKSSCDFLALVRRYVPHLRHAGRQYVGLCPFHREGHPSFFVEPLRKIFHCFGCGVGGDVFDFVMLIEGCDFRGALEIVASFLGVAAESGPRSGPRFRGGVGAKPLKPAKQASSHSPDERARIIAQLDGTEGRLRRIRATNYAASAALATACERDRAERSEAPLLEIGG